MSFSTLLPLAMYCSYTYHVHFPLLQYPNADTVAKHIVAVIKTFRDLKPSIKEYGRMSLESVL